MSVSSSPIIQGAAARVRGILPERLFQKSQARFAAGAAVFFFMEAQVRTQHRSPRLADRGQDGLVRGLEILRVVLPLAAAGWLVMIATP